MHVLYILKRCLSINRTFANLNTSCEEFGLVTSHCIYIYFVNCKTTMYMYITKNMLGTPLGIERCPHMKGHYHPQDL